MKKLLAVLLTLSILFSLAACGAGTDSPPEETSAALTPSAPAAEEETEAETAPPVPKEDFGGVDFNVLAACEQWQDFYAAEQTGDVVDDAVYERNLWLEEYNNYIFSRDVGDIINTIANKNYASNWEKSLKVYTKKIAKLIETVRGLET